MPKIQPEVKKRVALVSRELLEQKGPVFTMRDAAKYCDIALGTIYNYYPSKAELMVDIVAVQWNECFEKITMLSADTFYEELHQMYDIYSVYLDKFLNVFMKGLSSLGADGKRLSISKNEEYGKRLETIIEGVIRKYADDLDGEMIEFFGITNLAQFIQNHFTGMVVNHQKEYKQVDYFIKKVFGK